MRIGEAAALVGIATHVLRHWDELGVVVPDRASSGHREYTEEHVRRLRVVQACQDVGMGLAEVRQVLHRGTAGRGTVIAARLAAIRRHRAELDAAETFLEHVQQCRHDLLSRCPRCSAYADRRPPDAPGTVVAAALERGDAGAFPYLLHGGDAPVQAQWYFRTASRLPVAVHRWRFPPGASEGDHVHSPGGVGELDELYLLVGGRATMTVGGDRVELGPGDAVLAPAGVEHGVRNDGPDAAEFVVVFGHPGEPLDWNAYGTGRAAEAASPQDP